MTFPYFQKAINFHLPLFKPHSLLNIKWKEKERNYIFTPINYNIYNLVLIFNYIFHTLFAIVRGSYFLIYRSKELPLNELALLGILTLGIFCGTVINSFIIIHPKFLTTLINTVMLFEKSESVLKGRN